MRLSRRAFVASAASVAAAHALRAQNVTAHTSVAEIERAHILASAAAAMQPANGQPSRRLDDPAGLRAFSAEIAALMAAFLLTRDKSYADHVRQTVLLNLVLPSQFLFAVPSRPDAVLDLIPLAELARAISFLPDFDTQEVAQDTSGLPLLNVRANALSRFATPLRLLNVVSAAQLARDSKDHRASAWLLVAAACARATQDEEQLDKLRLRFTKPTLRNQISPEGKFPQELASDNPWRNTLFNFDLLAGACQLLSTPFDDLWKFELIEGTGMRSCAAYLYPLLKEPAHWPAIADAQFFREVPRRRPALLLAGRAYDRAEYVQLFASLPPPDPPAEIAYSLPITQPILWTTRAPHGL